MLRYGPSPQGTPYTQVRYWFLIQTRIQLSKLNGDAGDTRKVSSPYHVFEHASYLQILSHSRQFIAMRCVNILIISMSFFFTKISSQ